MSFETQTHTHNQTHSTFELNKNIEELVLHVSLWDWSKYAEHEFMGHLIIPFSEVLDKPNLNINKWFHLLPAPGNNHYPWSFFFFFLHFFSSFFFFIFFLHFFSSFFFFIFFSFFFFSVSIKVSEGGGVISLLKPMMKRQSKRVGSMHSMRLFLFIKKFVVKLKKPLTF